ncbi:LOW QUALITY PROTEIN: hypothetical protein CRUP_004841 [Coryphaenoides rupestris]|nr:LOW QUALITY PROTEIN: hypothetical protein CRUP_004841 [Coryphaenoides rupestris]
MAETSTNQQPAGVHPLCLRVSYSTMDRLLRLGGGMPGLGQGPPTDAPAVDTAEQVYISSLALLKMLKHGRAGVPMEVMGLMLGEFVDDYTVRVIDVFAMPQSGTGVSVEAVDPVFQAKMLDMLKQTGSHPGFGCWLSGVDINTQQSFEALSERAVAVVVDPIQSVKGKVVIDAFRLINANMMVLGHEPRQTTSNLGHLNKPSIQALIHGLNRHYYSITINYRKNELEQKMLLNLHKKSWMEGLTLTDYSEHCKLNEDIVKEMLELAKNYNKAVEEEDKMTPEQLAIKNVGKQDPKRHLEEHVDVLMTSNIVQCLAAMLDTVVFHAVDCTRKGGRTSTRDTRQSGQYQVYPEHRDAASVRTAAGCSDNGRTYQLNQRWEKMYQGNPMVCSCNGDDGVSCKSRAQDQSTCHDATNGRTYRVGETYERPKDGMIWDCTCITAGRVSCTIANRCHEDGHSYVIGDTWQRPHQSGAYMLQCVCLGNNKGEWTCKPIAERCYDSAIGSSYVVGDTWERTYQGWMMVDCTCLGEDNGRITCTTKNRCNDPQTQGSYRIGQTWTKTTEQGVPQVCTCTGNGRGEWKCEHTVQGTALGRPLLTPVRIPLETSLVTHVKILPLPQPAPPTEGTCVTDAGTQYLDGQRWVRTQGSKQLICTCMGNGIHCTDWEARSQVYGGNADGRPCAFPFTYGGRMYYSCTQAGRTDGQLWCSTTADYDTDQLYSFCREKYMMVPTRGGNSNGALCHFPFLYNGRNYTECTTDGRRDGMKWCSTSPEYTTNSYGFCPMAAHEEVCTTNDGTMHRVGDKWDKRHASLGHMMQCTCLGSGRGEWSCIAYTQLRDQCIVSGQTYDVNQAFSKRHDLGYMMNCTCFGQGRGRWKYQCQEPVTQTFYQIGDSWDKLNNGIPYRCTCLGNGAGEMTCELQQGGVNRPVRVTISEGGQNPDSRPILWNVLPTVHKNTRAPWKQVIVPGQLTSYTISGLRAGVTYEGQLISASESVTEITSNSFVISWTSAADTISGFRVEYELSEEGAETKRINLPRTTTSVNIDKLLPGRRYNVKVFELPTGGQPNLILTASQTTAFCRLVDLLPAVLYNISIFAVEEDLESLPVFLQVLTMGSAFYEVTDTKISLTWEGPPEEVTGYMVVFHEGTQQPLTLPLSSVAKVEITSLKPGTQYRFFIYAVNGAAKSEPLTGFQTTTTVVWAAPQSPVTGYLLVLSRQGKVLYSRRVPLATTHYLLKTLEPETEYTVTLHAHLGQDLSPETSQHFTTTSETGTFPNYTPVYTDTSILVTWAPVPRFSYKLVARPTLPSAYGTTKSSTSDTGRATVIGLTSGTEYTYSLQPMRPDTLEEVVGPEQTSWTLDGLSPGVEHDISVVALKGDQESRPVSTTDLQISGVGPDYMRVTWSIPDVPTPSQISRFVVRYHPAASDEDLKEINEGGATNTVLLQNLLPYTEYRVSVVCVYGDRESEPVSTTARTMLDSPTGLDFSEISTSSFTVHWVAATAPITGYKLRFTQPSSGKKIKEETLTPTHTHYTLTGLQPETEYQVSLYSKNGDDLSNPLSGAQGTVSDAPSDLVVVSSEDNKISISWDAPSVPLRYYRITYGTEGETLQEFTLNGRETNATISGLSPATDYTITVYAVGGRGDNPSYSTPVSVKHRTDLERPKGLEVTRKTPNSLTVRWAPASGPYTIRVSALDRDSKASLPAVQTATTDIDSPKQLSFSEVQPESMRISWVRPTGTVSSYRVQYSSPRERERELRPAPQPGQSSTVLRGLRPGTVYTIRVTAFQDRRPSEPLVGSYATALPAPVDLRLDSVEATEVVLSWQAPDSQLTGYRVVFLPKDSDLEGPIKELHLAPDTTNATVSGLMVGTTYIIQVFALQNTLSSKPLTREVTTLQDVSPPRQVIIREKTESSFTLTWRTKLEPISGFLIMATPIFRTSPPVREVIPGDRKQYTLTGLQPDTAYEITMYTLNGAAKSAPYTLTETTEKPAFQPPTHLDVMSVTPTSISFRWRPPSTRITGYFLTYEESGRPPRALRPSPHAGQDYASIQEEDPLLSPINPVEETEVPDVVTSSGQPGRDGYGQGVEYEYSNNGGGGVYSGNGGTPPQETLVLLPLPDQHGHRTPLLPPHVPTDNYFDFIEKASGLPQEAQTRTTLSWPAHRQSTAYKLTCRPLAQSGETEFQALKGLLSQKILDKVITTGSTVTEGGDTCYDDFTTHAVGAQWERMSETGFKLWCKCLGMGSGHFRCDSSKWCHDNNNNYGVGEKWERTEDNGRKLSCTCLGNGKGEFKCDPHESVCYDEGTSYQASSGRRSTGGAICTCSCYGGQQGWRCENCRKPGSGWTWGWCSRSATETPPSPLIPKLHCPIECLRPNLLADAIHNPLE